MKRRGKKGQFYLVTTIMIIAIILGFVSLTNFVQKRSSLKFYYEGEEMDIESEKVIDYILSQGDAVDTKTQLRDFVYNYTNYSDADSFYFLFGDSAEMNFIRYDRLHDGNIKIEHLGDPLIPNENPIEESTTKDQYFEANFADHPVGELINISVEDPEEILEFKFNLTEGINFYYVFSKEIGGDRYLETNA